MCELPGRLKQSSKMPKGIQRFDNKKHGTCDVLKDR